MKMTNGPYDDPDGGEHQPEHGRDNHRDRSDRNN